MSLQLDSLVKSIDVLERSIKTANRVDDSDEDLQETVRAGVIQNFEIAYDHILENDETVAYRKYW